MAMARCNLRRTTRPSGPRRPLGTPALVLLGLAAAAAAACSNAVPYGADSAMVPLDQPVQGCRAYRLTVEGGYTPAIVYFRRADGSFTKDRRQAACPLPAPPP